MNGLILESAPHGKDIKFIGKKDADIKSDEAGDLFEKLLVNLVEDEKESTNKEFLLAKLLNISSDLEIKGKNISDFSKDDLFSMLDDTKSNTSKLDELLKLDTDDEFVTLQELFKVAYVIKNDQKPDLNEIKSTPTKEILSTPKVINQLKSAKNIKALLNIADKNGIKVKNFEFFKEERVLDQADKKLVQKVTSQDLFKLITPKEQVNIDKHLKSSQHKAEKHQPSKKSILATLINKTPSNKSIKTSNETVKHIEQIVTTPSAKPKTKISNTNNIQTENIIELDLNESDLESVTKNRATSKTESLREKASNTDKNISNIINNTQTEIETKGKDETISSENSSSEIEDLSTTHKNENQTEIKSETTTHKTKDTHDIKRSLNTFATEFKEKVESYKAPLMKIKMQLSPQNLGDVDVTLVNRGSSLHVNITSNNQSMAIFMQNQAEFKNSLVNMGFSDLQMNFSQNQDSRQQQNNKKDKNDDSSSYEDMVSNEDSNPSIDLILPNYV